MMAWYSRAAAALSLGALITVGFLACSTDEDGKENPGGEARTDPEPLFRELEADLVASCGGRNGSCHVRGNQAPRWLADPDPYVSAKRYRGILPATRDVGDSILLTQVRHTGPALKDVPVQEGKLPLFERVGAWLQAELPPPPLPSTGPFSVASGFNSIPLDAVASGLQGGRISFLATDNNGVLTMSALRVHAPMGSNVRIVSPFFVILPRSGKVNADPEVNGFEGELTVPAGAVVDLFGGKMILLRWDPAGQLKLVFSEIETTPGQGVLQGCTAIETFKSRAIPAMQAQLDVLAHPDDYDPDGGVEPGTVIGKGSCVGCHAAQAGSEGPTTAVQAMDLRGISEDPERACAQARLWINFENKAESTLLLNPKGQGNPQHPVKSLADSDPIMQGLKAWVDDERER
jgi:hypothetical protein